MKVVSNCQSTSYTICVSVWHMDRDERRFQLSLYFIYDLCVSVAHGWRLKSFLIVTLLHLRFVCECGTWIEMKVVSNSHSTSFMISVSVWHVDKD
jgi:hypothetical protein